MNKRSSLICSANLSRRSILLSRVASLSYKITKYPTVFTSNDIDELPDYSQMTVQCKNLFYNSKCRYVHPTDFKYQLPKNNVPEFAFIGRSNVGKSTLIDRLLGNKNLVRISKEPGCTKNINYFTFYKSDSKVKKTADELNDHLIYLVDLPGYGYAKKSKAEREQWTSTILDYLTQRSQAVLRRIFLLVDSRRGIKDLDLEVMAQLNDVFIPYQVVFTKGDLVKPSEMHKTMSKSMDLICSKHGGTCLPIVHVVSALSKDDHSNGIRVLQQDITEISSHKWIA